MSTQGCVAVHLRNADHISAISNVKEHVLSLYRDLDRHQVDQGLTHSLAPHPCRIYIGDEFCPHRLPSPKELIAFVSLADQRGLGVSLLTPFLSEDDLEVHYPLFDLIGSSSLPIEIVVNDVGLLWYLRTQYPTVTLAAGRLLNHGPKDPRCTKESQSAEGMPSAVAVDALVAGCTFGQAPFQGLLRGLGVTRLERDLLPNERDGLNDPIASFSSSIYFPYGYFTTGRICWIASFDRWGKAKFAPLRVCSRPCEKVGFVASLKENGVKIVQHGNTFFYRYQTRQVRTLLAHALLHEIRLVYQGFAISLQPLFV